jgi:hypothetical protein
MDLPAGALDQRTDTLRKGRIDRRLGREGEDERRLFPCRGVECVDPETLPQTDERLGSEREERQQRIDDEMVVEDRQARARRDLPDRKERRASCGPDRPGVFSWERASPLVHASFGAVRIAVITGHTAASRRHESETVCRAEGRRARRRH